MSMTITVPDDNAIEESTYVITVTLKDNADSLVSPNTLRWSLTDEEGNVMNSRSNVAVSDPSSEETIALTHKDLAIPGVSRTRIVTFEASYDDTDLGLTNLRLKNSAQFTIDDLVKVEYSSASSSSSSESSSSSSESSSSSSESSSSSASSSSSSQSSSSSSESSSSSSAT